MKKYIFKAFAIVAILCTGMTFTGCSDPEDIQDLKLDRILSPINLSARVSNNLNIVVNWAEMSGATAYEIEAYADSPDYDQRTPDLSATVTATTYTFQNLIGETTYYIRVRAIDENNASRNSKWMNIDRTTGSEQNMNKVKAGDIEATSVKLTWTPGIQVDQIILTPASSTSSAPTVTYTLTATDIANGYAIVTGLQPETSYKATLKLGEKTRGTANFSTNVDFSDATVLTPDMDWITAIQDAAAGTKFALAPGTYVNTAAKLQINSSVIIGAQSSSDLPVINSCIHVNNGSSLTLYHVVLDGAGTDGSQAVEFKTVGNFGALVFEGCEMKNYTKGLIYINVAAAVSEIKVNNCIIHEIECNGGDFIDSRKGGWDVLNFTNNTVYNSAQKRDWFRADVAADVSVGMTTTVDHNTFYNCGSGKASYRIFYTRNTNNNQSFTNNLVIGFKNTRGFSNGTVTVPEYKNNYYHDCENLTTIAEGNTQTGVDKYLDTTGNILTHNPCQDAPNANFYIVDEELRSFGFGDPRWN